MGHAIVRLVRRPVQNPAEEVYWNPEAGAIDRSALNGLDAVVHLAGESIAGRWTVSKKRRIRDSRVLGTRLLSGALAGADPKPSVFVSASAVGYYGDRGEAALDEDSPPGSGFLAEVCQEWEAASARGAEAGIRVVHARFGVVLSSRGGALAQMLVPYRLGLGGVIGTGRQYMSWISLEDAVRAVEYCLATATVSGPVNVVAPEPCQNKDFVKALGAVLHRPTILPVPATAVRLALGDMGQALLLSSTRAVPTRLSTQGFGFLHPDILSALRYACGTGSVADTGVN